MASTHKTSLVALNQWLLTDKPKMQDFNNDNIRIDNFLKGHLEDGSIHMTGEQSAWVGQPYVTGTYSGDGAASRTINVGFQPALLFVFAQNYGPIEIDTVNNNPQIRFAAAADGFGSTGVTLTQNGFTVVQMQQNPLAGLSKTCLNQNGVAYRYFAMRRV